MARARDFGSVRKLDSGRWQARYRGPDGQRRAAPTTFKTEREASRWLSLKEAEIARGEWVDPNAGKISVVEWGERWLASVRESLKPKTFASYESLFRALVVPAFGNRELRLVRPINVAEWITAMKRRNLSASRIRQAHVVLSQIMKSAVQNELIYNSPCQNTKLPRLPRTEPHILADDEVRRLIAVSDAPLDLIVQTLAYAGLRIGEVFALRRGRIALKAGQIVVAETLVEIGGRLSFGTPKSHEMRVVKIPAFLVKAFAAHMEKMTDKDPSALLFVGRTGKPLHYNAWRTWKWDPAVKAAELEGVTPHDLRATHATNVANEHGVMAAAARLGHSNASVTTRHYARTRPGTDDRVAESLDQAHGADASDSGADTGHGDDDEDPPGVLAAV